MSEIVRITVDGAPVGKGRPRFVRSRGIAFTPAKTANYEAILAAAGAQAMHGRAPLEGPLALHLTAFMPVPESWSKRKKAQALSGGLRPGKPDLDNILKVMDALNQIVWRDDAQIAEARLSKLYNTDPRLEIEVERLRICPPRQICDPVVTASEDRRSIRDECARCGRASEWQQVVS